MTTDLCAQSTLTRVEGAADGFAAVVEATAPDTAMASRTNTSTGRSAKNAITSFRLNTQRNGKQSLGLKKELAEWRTPTTSAKRKTSGEDRSMSTRREETDEHKKADWR